MHNVRYCVKFAEKKRKKMGNKTFVIHDESVNTYGFRMLTSGANLEVFRKNPVMLLNHSDFDLPIGRWENIRIEGTQILADAVFDMQDPRGAEVARKVEGGFIKAASIGAWAPEEMSDSEDLKLPGQTGKTVTRWTVREVSICPIPANHNALVLYDTSTGAIIESASIIELMDNKHKCNMAKVKEILKLSDMATEEDVAQAVETLQQERDALKKENQALRDAEKAREAEEKKAKHEEAVALVDAAVKDGRIDVAGKDVYLSLFDHDFKQAKAALAAIPKYEPVLSQVNQGGDVTLKDFQGKTWRELDRAGKLSELKDKSPELYSELYKEEFGVEPKL